MSCGKKGTWERQVCKFSSKQFGRSSPSTLAFEAPQHDSDENNMYYVKFTKTLTKTCKSALSAIPRSFLPKMFATGGDRCPVTIFKKFLSPRPPKIQTTSILYLSYVPNNLCILKNLLVLIYSKLHSKLFD